MNTGFPFHIYYPKLKHTFLIQELVQDLVTDLYQNKEVLGILFWADQYKGENISFYVKCMSEPGSKMIKAMIEEKVNAFMLVHFETRSNDIQEDSFFMDYATNQLSFNNYKYEKEKIAHIAKCLTSTNAQLTITHLSILQAKGAWSAINKLKLSFALLSNFMLLLRRNFKTDVTGLMEKLYLDFIDHYNFDTVTKELHLIVQRGHSMYDAIESELTELRDNNEEVISSALYTQWMNQTSEIIASSGKSKTKVYSLTKDIFILTCLELGLGPDTGLMLLIWIQKSVCQVEVRDYSI